MLAEIEVMAPQEIEKRSFEIITEELKHRGIKLSGLQAPVIKRCIHILIMQEILHFRKVQ